jgi:hypothetical protein
MDEFETTLTIERRWSNDHLCVGVKIGLVEAFDELLKGLESPVHLEVAFRSGNNVRLYYINAL